MAGESLTLTCSATTTGRGTPTFSWTGQASRGPQLGKTAYGSTNMFTDTLQIDRVIPINSTILCVASINNLTASTSIALFVTGNV